MDVVVVTVDRGWWLCGSHERSLLLSCVGQPWWLVVMVLLDVVIVVRGRACRPVVVSSL